MCECLGLLQLYGIIKRKQTEILELKNVMNEMKNALESINNGINQTEERICDLENRNFESI